MTFNSDIPAAAARHDAMAERSRAVGEALQRTVAADPAVAVSIVGIGVDALSGVLINSPDQLPGFGGWVNLIASLYAYVMDGTHSAIVDDLLAGSLTLADTPR